MTPCLYNLESRLWRETGNPEPINLSIKQCNENIKGTLEGAAPSASVLRGGTQAWTNLRLYCQGAWDQPLSGE